MGSAELRRREKSLDVASPIDRTALETLRRWLEQRNWAASCEAKRQLSLDSVLPPPE